MLAGSGLGTTIAELVGISILLLVMLQLIAFLIVRVVRSRPSPRGDKRSGTKRRRHGS